MSATTIKAITLWQPWASFVAIGAKRFETRSWRTDYRGPIAIHAAQRPMRAAELNTMAHLVKKANMAWLDFPFGQVVAIGWLKQVYSVETAIRHRHATVQELHLGDWSAGRFAWHIDPIWKLAQPVSARGRQRLWDWQLPDSLAEEYAEWREVVQQ